MATQAQVDAARRRVEAAQRAVADARRAWAAEEARGGRGPKTEAIERNMLQPAQAALASAAKREETVAAAFSAAQAEERRYNRRQKELERQRDPLEQIRQVALAIGAPLAGMYAGKAFLAPAIEKKSAAAVAARNVQAARVAAEVDKAMRMPAGAARSAKLAGIVRTADQLGLTRQKGPFGLLTAGLLGAEALALRSAASDMKNETSAEVTRAAGMALGFAAGGLISQRSIERATTARVVDARAMAAIEQARAVLAAEKAGVHVAGPASGAQAAASGPKALEAMTIKELRSEGRRLGVRAPTSLSKADLLAAIKQRTAAGASRAPSPLSAAQSQSVKAGEAAAAARAAAPASADKAAKASSFFGRTLGRLRGGRLGLAVTGGLAAVGIGSAANAAAAPRGRAFVGADARRQAAESRRAPAEKAARSGPRSRVAYTKRDGSTVITTAGRARAYRARRRAR